MDTTNRLSLLTRLGPREETKGPRCPVLIPLEELPAFHLLAREIGRMAATDPGDHLVLIVDSVTAHHIDTADAVRQVAEHVYLFGDAPGNWVSASNVTSCDLPKDITASDRFMAVISDKLSLAVIGTELQPPRTGFPSFRGGWTGQRSCVERVVQTLLESVGVTLPEFPRDRVELVEHDFSRAAQLMTNLTEHLKSQQRGVVIAKEDLLSILDMLKTMSSKRRAHDVLYVFVEHVARVIPTRRCSVVRVWGSTDTGHVIASHDDPSLNDLIIDLVRYPELLRALDTRCTVLINDIDREPTTRKFREELHSASIRAILVVPVVLFDPYVGSLLLRAARTDHPFTEREVAFCEVVAEVTSNALERAYLFESIQLANERLERLSVTDGLTDLKNHRYFRERLEYEFDRGSRYSQPLALMMIDIDNFKVINDSFGHLQGDIILQEMAHRILLLTRKSDIAARYGGEEFAIIMPQTDLAGAQTRAQRLLHELRAFPYKGIPHDYPLTVSIGVAALDNKTMLDCEALIRAADSALYQAKRRGKNCVVAATPEGDT